MAEEQRRAVGVIIQHGGEFGRNLLRGIHAYLMDGLSWHLTVSDYKVEAIHALARQKLAGLIAFLPDQPVLEAAMSLGVPTVNVSGWLPDGTGPLRVRVDDELIGRRVAEHFLERQLRHFAYFSLWDAAWGKRREESFVRTLAEAGVTQVASARSFLKMPMPAGPHAPGEDPRLVRWLTQLPKPVGVFAANDSQALVVAEACHQAGIHVPSEIALVGVDNDELLCELAWSPLSSVDSHTRQVGFEAARLLEEYMSGAITPGASGAPRVSGVAGKTILVPPGEVVSRLSSAIMATDDSEVKDAMAFIVEAAGRGIDVTDVLDHATIGRRALEQRFRAAFGRTIADEIRRAKVGIARRLLRQTDLPLRAIARRSGFNSPQRFHVAFQHFVGVTPTKFRHEPRLNLRPQ